MSKEPTLYTTPEGARRLRKRLGEALARYDEVVSKNPEAAESGDNCVWHDNFAYEEAQRQMHSLGRRVRDLRLLIDRVLVVTPPEAPRRVGVGTVVELVFVDTGESERWVIAGHEDGDPRLGRLSYSSPLGSLLMGAEVGDERRLVRQGRQVSVCVEAIEPLVERPDAENLPLVESHPEVV